MKPRRTKLHYSIQFGLVKYYIEKIFSSLVSKTVLPLKFISSNERFNTVSKQKQMDIQVIYFYSFRTQVVCCYTGSDFVGCGSTDQLVKSWESVHEGLVLTHHLVQLSVDGLNVNLKTINIINENGKEQGGDALDLVDTGTCELHVLQGTFGYVQKSILWELDKLLKAIHYF